MNLTFYSKLGSVPEAKSKIETTSAVAIVEGIKAVPNIRASNTKNQIKPGI
jgi:hypothetical protein